MNENTQRRFAVLHFERGRPATTDTTDDRKGARLIFQATCNLYPNDFIKLVDRSRPRPRTLRRQQGLIRRAISEVL